MSDEDMHAWMTELAERVARARGPRYCAGVVQEFKKAFPPGSQLGPLTLATWLVFETHAEQPS